MGPYDRGLFPVSLLAAVALLVGGYVMAGFWWVVPAAAAILLFCWIARRIGWRWLPSALLVLYVIVAAGGGLVGISPVIMIAGVAAALVSWDLAKQHEHRTSGGAHRLGRHFELAHIKLLTTSVGIGLLFAGVGLFLELPIPFGGMILAGLFVMYGLFRFYRLLMKEPGSRDTITRKQQLSRTRTG